MALSPLLLKSVNFEINGEQAKAVLDSQFERQIRLLQEARILLNEGKFSRAYQIFPYHDRLGENLEEFVKNIKDTNPNL